jgi:hypothetical protein
VDPHDFDSDSTYDPDAYLDADPDYWLYLMRIQMLIMIRIFI